MQPGPDCAQILHPAAAGGCDGALGGPAPSGPFSPGRRRLQTTTSKSQTLNPAAAGGCDSALGRSGARDHPCPAGGGRRQPGRDRRRQVHRGRPGPSGRQGPLGWPACGHLKEETPHHGALPHSILDACCQQPPGRGCRPPGLACLWAPQRGNPTPQCAALLCPCPGRLNPPARLAEPLDDAHRRPSSMVRSPALLTMAVTISLAGRAPETACLRATPKGNL